MLIDNLQINKLFELFEIHNSTPITELEYINPFTLLVAVVLSAQATDIKVNQVTSELFKKYNTPEQFIILGEENLKNYIKTIGLYNNKSKNIIKISNILIDKYNGQVPNDFQKLLSLPGVGRKSANVILNACFAGNRIAVDTHVFRVARRIGLSNKTTPSGVEKQLTDVIPRQWHKNVSNWLVLHGRYICKARFPYCDLCFVNTICLFYKLKKNG